MAEPVSEFVKMSLDYSVQSAQQLMALAVGILALSVTFIKDIVKENARWFWLLKLSWVLFLMSIIFGLYVMMNTSSLINELVMYPELPSSISDVIRINKMHSSMQFIAFALGCGSLLYYAMASLRNKKIKNSKTETD
ncbi:MAG TPA: hypothetical protein VF721_19760 [Pyrinomonadaceae bacterium]|jgi:acyl-coenzyme A synthetase/AMP-(fatty) acid ligase